MRKTRSGLQAIRAECEGCAWVSRARNAKGNAARHHDATGHTVLVEEVTTTVYGDPNAPIPGQIALTDA